MTNERQKAAKLMELEAQLGIDSGISATLVERDTAGSGPPAAGSATATVGAAGSSSIAHAHMNGHSADPPGFSGFADGEHEDIDVEQLAQGLRES